MERPLVFRYQEALSAFRAGRGDRDTLLKRMSELIALLDLSSSLSAQLPAQEILDAVLLTTLGELGAGRGAIFVKGEDGRDQLRAARGWPAGAPRTLALDLDGGIRDRQGGGGDDALGESGLEMVCPVVRGGRRLGSIGVGPRADGQQFSDEDRDFLESVAASAATPIENGLVQDALRQVNRRLSLNVYQLKSLFDISRELVASQDEESIKSLTVTTIMGHLMLSRCALFLDAPEGLVLAHARGLTGQAAEALMHAPELGALLGGLSGPTHTGTLPEGALRERLQGHGLECLVPLGPTGACDGLVAMGARASGAPFGDEDCDFVLTLGRQALAALENVRLQRVQLEKQRQDREMQIAREIQVSLFPESFPDIPGFDVAAETRPCYEVGGDYYDVIDLGDGRWALLIADVSGKGVPASILMASVHASLHALAGTGEPAAIVGRLNRFLYESTQPSRYVTLFYGELDPAGGRLTYVNGGHVPPYLLAARGGLRRLDTGGPAVGLLEDATYEAETIALSAGDVVAAVTDGATEACSAGDEEFGDARVVVALAQARTCGAAGRLRDLFERVGEWAGPAGQSDDLTALILEAR